MYYVLLILLAVIPSLVIFKVVYAKDREKEPLRLLIGLFGLGITSCFLTVLLSSILKYFLPFFDFAKAAEYQSNLLLLFIYVFVGIALIEEFSKWIFNYSVIWRNREFNHIYDAIIYSTCASLGFATFENVLYVLEGGVGTAILRSVLSVPNHACFGIVMGYYLGLAKVAQIRSDSNRMRKNLLFSILMPALLHTFYDFCLLSQNTWLLLIFLGFVIWIYKKSIEKLKQFSRVEKNLDQNI